MSQSLILAGDKKAHISQMCSVTSTLFKVKGKFNPDTPVKFSSSLNDCQQMFCVAFVSDQDKITLPRVFRGVTACYPLTMLRPQPALGGTAPRVFLCGMQTGFLRSQCGRLWIRLRKECPKQICPFLIFFLYGSRSFSSFPRVSHVCCVCTTHAGMSPIKSKHTLIMYGKLSLKSGSITRTDRDMEDLLGNVSAGLSPRSPLRGRLALCTRRLAHQAEAFLW